MIRTVKDLKDALDDVMDDNTPVKIWMQPNYPMQYSIGDVQIANKDGEDIVYITEGNQDDYAPRLQ